MEDSVIYAVKIANYMAVLEQMTGKNQPIRPHQFIFLFLGFFSEKNGPNDRKKKIVLTNKRIYNTLLTKEILQNNI